MGGEKSRGAGPNAASYGSSRCWRRRRKPSPLSPTGGKGSSGIPRGLLLFIFFFRHGGLWPRFLRCPLGRREVAYTRDTPLFLWGATVLSDQDDVIVHGGGQRWPFWEGKSPPHPPTPIVLCIPALHRPSYPSVVVCTGPIGGRPVRGRGQRVVSASSVEGGRHRGEREIQRYTGDDTRAVPSIRKEKKKNPTTKKTKKTRRPKKKKENHTHPLSSFPHEKSTPHEASCAAAHPHPHEQEANGCTHAFGVVGGLGRRLPMAVVAPL